MRGTVALLATAPDARIRTVLPWIQARGSRLVLVVPRQRRASFADLDARRVAVVPFDGSVAPGDAWEATAAAVRAAAPDLRAVYVAVNDQGLGAYRDVAAASAALGLPAHRVVFLLPHPAGAAPPTRTLAAWRRAEAASPWPARRAAVVRAIGDRRMRSGAGMVAAVVALAAAWPLVVRWPAAVSAALLLASHVLTWRYAAATAGEYSGDAAIHYQFARRFARGEWFCYNPGTFSAGSSSPLWTLLLGIVARFAGERRLEALATQLAWASLHLSLLLVALAAARAHGVDSLWGLAPVAIASSARVFLWTGRVMDAPFALLANVVVVAALVGGQPVAIAAAVAVACLTRWEHVALLLPAIGWAAWQAASPWPFVAFVPVGVLALDTARRLGSVVPASGRARRRYAARRAGAWRADWQLWLTRPDLWLLAVIGVIALPSALAGVLAAWLVATVLFFVAVVPGTYGGRYLIPALAPHAILAAAGGSRLLAVPVPSLVWIGGCGLLAWTAVRWGHTAWADRPRTAMAAAAAAADERGFRTTVAQGLARLLPPGATLALIEVDLLWPIERDDIRVVSLDGVLDATILGALDRGELMTELAQRRVTHVLIESCLYDRHGWRHLDLARLCDEQPAVAFGDHAVARPLAAWGYRRWGQGRDEWPWRLWELTFAPAGGDACSR